MVQTVDLDVVNYSYFDFIISNNLKILLFDFYSRSILNQGIQKCTKETATEDVMFKRSIKNVPSKIQPKVDTGLRRTNTKTQVWGHVYTLYKLRRQQRERELLNNDYLVKVSTKGGGESKIPKILSTWFVHIPYVL